MAVKAPQKFFANFNKKSLQGGASDPIKGTGCSITTKTWLHPGNTKPQRKTEMKLLNTAAGNAKILKSQKGSGYRIASLSLYPDLKTCPASLLAECLDPCLKDAGRGAMSTVKAGRQSKTDLFHSDLDLFLEMLVKEMRNFEKLCKKQGFAAAFRLNTISDVPFEKFGIPQLFPDALLYDYTKQASRLFKTPDNYKLMFSYSQAEKYQRQVNRALQTAAPVAVVFRGFVPVGQYFLGREIVDGDKSDLENLKQNGKILGLRLKGGKAVQAMRSPFVVEPEQAAALQQVA